MIETPIEDKRRAAPRKIAESLAQATPVTAFFAELYGFTHPSQFEHQLEKWRTEITNKTNEHTKIIDFMITAMTPKLVVSDLALAIAVWLLEHSPKGLDWESIDFSRIVEAFDTEAQRNLEKACAELEMYGWVTTNGAIGHAIRTVSPKYQVFWVLDFSVTGFSTIDDALKIASLLVSDPTMRSIPRLQQHLAWTLRRLNPPLAYALQFIGQGRISKSPQPDYVTRSVSLNHEDEMRLDRFVRGI